MPKEEMLAGSHHSEHGNMYVASTDKSPEKLLESVEGSVQPVRDKVELQHVAEEIEWSRDTRGEEEEVVEEIPMEIIPDADSVRRAKATRPIESVIVEDCDAFHEEFSMLHEEQRNFQRMTICQQLLSRESSWDKKKHNWYFAIY